MFLLHSPLPDKPAMIVSNLKTIGKARLLCGALVILTLACCLAVLAWPVARDSSGDLDVAARPLDLIPAGTVIDNEAPRGWSHLLLKSRPRPGAGDVAQLSANHRELASFLFTALVADVQRDSGRYRL